MNTENPVASQSERRRELHLVPKKGGLEGRQVFDDVRLALIRLEIELWRLEVFLHAEEIQRAHATQDRIQ